MPATRSADCLPGASVAPAHPVRVAVATGGLLAVMNVIPDEQPTPRWVALYEVGLLLRTASGRVQPLAAYLGWLYDAGFEPPERHAWSARCRLCSSSPANPPTDDVRSHSSRAPPSRLQLSTYLRPRRSVVSCEDTG
jgi:hypothetical protein